MYGLRKDEVSIIVIWFWDLWRGLNEKLNLLVVGREFEIKESMETQGLCRVEGLRM